MFLCVSANPAIDKRLRLTRLTPGQVHRAVEALPTPGGKAAHVAMVLHELGADPLWIGFAGGANGQELMSGLGKRNIRVLGIPIKEATRENLEIIEDDGVVTEILEPGPACSELEIKNLLDACGLAFTAPEEPKIAVLSGSLPQTAPMDLYARLIRLGNSHGCKMFLDSSGEALRLGLAAQPYFVKPNREEAEWLTGTTLGNAAAGAGAVRQLIAEGAKSAAISLGDSGLLWRPADSECVYRAHPVKVAVRSAVGSGDATVAAFAFAAGSEMSAEETLRLAAACGAANCLAESPGNVQASDIRRLQKEVRIEILS